MTHAPSDLQIVSEMKLFHGPQGGGWGRKDREPGSLQFYWTYPPGLGETLSPDGQERNSAISLRAFFVLFRGQLLPIWETCEH